MVLKNSSRGDLGEDYEKREAILRLPGKAPIVFEGYM